MNDQSSEQPNPGYYWLATDEEAAQVASHLGISLAPSDAKQISGSYSRIFRFGGDGNEQRVLKIRARWMTEGRLRFEHALAGHLRDSGLPFVAPLADERGSTWANVGELYCEITPYVDGRAASPALADVHLMGELLGHFHRSSREFDSGAYEQPYFQNQAEPQELEPEVGQLLRQTSEMQTEDAERIRALCARWKEMVDSYQGPNVSSLPRVLRDGDFHPWNLLFSRTESRSIVALFDLDMAAPGPRIYDISYAIHMLRGLFIGWNVENWDTRYREFIKSYMETDCVPLGEEEIAVVPLQIELIALGFLARTAADVGFQSAADEYEKYIAVVDWLKTWRPELTRILRSEGLL